ncbi:MAG: glycosyltransferase [Cellulomonadaceae bacterium]
MRILVATTWFPTPASPTAGVFVAKDVAALAARHDVAVVHLVAPHLHDGGPEYVTQTLDFAGIAPARVRVRRVVMDTQRPDHLPGARAALLDAVRSADMLHTMAFSTLLPLAVGHRPPLPWVHTEHWQGVTARWHLPLAWRAAMPALSRALLRPDVVTAVSEYATAPIARLRGARPTDVVPCIAARPAHVLPRPGGPVLRLVAVGGLVPMKDPVVAVRTMAELASRGVEADLTWVGDGPLRAEVEREIADAGLADRVHLAGNLEPAEVSRCLGAADLFFLPTRRETFGVAIAEALTHGRPVVVGANGAQAEYVRPEIGTLVEQQSPPAYAEAIVDLAARTRDVPAQEVAAGVAGRFDPDVVVAGYDHAYAQARGVDETAAPDQEARLEVQSEVAHPEVDLVIAVHSAARPTRRAVDSVLRNDARVRVTVVCHNVAPARIAESVGELAADPRVRLVELADGVRSPAGPFNHGIAVATAPFVSIMGSDDQLAPGAIDSWLALQRETRAEMVITRLQRVGAAVVPTPPARPARRRDLDPVRDRLSYRSAPLGLMSRAAIERLGLRMTATMPVGSDVEFVSRLWFGAQRIAFDRRGPAYLIGADAHDRVTEAPRPIEVELRFLRALTELAWLHQLPPAARRAIAVKVTRIHLFGAVHNRPDPAVWTPAERADLAAAATAVGRVAPGYVRVLSRAERDLLDAVLDAGERSDAARLLALSRRRRRHGRPETLMPRNPLWVLAREAPLRLMTASVLTRWT